MNTTPTSNRIHITLFGRTNVGKSSLLNYLTGQDVSITSPLAGTTTDVVTKPMELLPLGPVVFIDTAGLGDITALSKERAQKTQKEFERADVIILVLEAGMWGEYEEQVLKKAREAGVGIVGLINKSDESYPDEVFCETVASHIPEYTICSTCDEAAREDTLSRVKEMIKKVLPADITSEPVLIADLVRAGQTAVLVVPIDLEAPKGRLILPQVQTIRDLLDADANALVVKERELKACLDNLKTPPAIVVCDSQAVLKVVADTPKDIPVTTFSILFSRFKGDIVTFARGAARMEHIAADSKILIAEACAHHAIGDDIGRVKIPRWIRQYAGCSPRIDVYAGRDYPENINEYDLVIHCGACMFNRRQMLSRLATAGEKEVAITNYGICISVLQGVIERTLAPFPHALRAYEEERKGRVSSEE